jgi:serine/threonine protein kinase/Tol biopolymer transport system component
MLEEIGPYRIVSRLGSGGMGEVYRASDTRLGREVAIKVLLPAVASDPERMGRFRREARVAASLNHPNIAAIYGFEEFDESHFLVMELVEGRSLADRLKAGPLPIDETLGIVEQVAGGLEAAHDAGIVHRDLKPSNVVLTSDGKAKILDFGVAKALEDDARSLPLEHSPTLSANFTSPGMMVGTVPYMSPEQARGRPVDRRSDIWALGCLLYECLTGRRAFDGDTSTDVLAKILERDPSWEALPARTPPRVRELVQRCLEKDVRRRIRDAGDVRIELERAREAREWTSTGAVLAVSTQRRFPPSLLWGIAGLTAAVAIAGIAFGTGAAFRSSGTSNRGTQRSTTGIPLRLDVTDPDVLRYPGSDSASVAIANDGQSVAYVGVAPGKVWWESEICLRRADEVHVTQRVPPPAKGYGVSNPFFSPDGKWLGFTSTGIYKVSLSGGRTIPVVENVSVGGVKGAVWTDRGIVYSPAAKAGLYRVGEDGGAPEPLTVPDASKGEVSHRWPAALPDGRHLLFTIKKEGITSFDQAEIAVLDLETKSWTTIIQGGSFGRYLPTGHIAYARGGSIVAVPYDVRSSKVTGPAFTVLSNVMTEPGSGAAQFAVAADAGALAYVPGGPNIQRGELVWLDRHGTFTPVGAPLAPYYDPRLSPDGNRIAATSFGATDTVVVYDITRGSSVPAKSEGNTALISWHPDGRQLLVSSDREGGEQRLYLVDADGTGAMRRVPLDIPGMDARSLVRIQDGAGLLYQLESGLYISRIDGAPSRQRLSGPGETDATRPALSPDGEWLAYDSNVAGRQEVFVRPFPTGNGSWQISRGGGVVARWSPRGDEILYQRDNGSTDRWLMSSRITPTAAVISARAPVELMKLPSGLQLSEFHPDGQRMLGLRPVAPEYAGDRVIEIVNWLDQVQAKAPGR